MLWRSHDKGASRCQLALIGLRAAEGRLWQDTRHGAELLAGSIHC